VLLVKLTFANARSVSESLVIRPKLPPRRFRTVRGGGDYAST